MFAAFAVACFVLVLFKVPVGFDLAVLGWAFVALHLAADGWAPWRRNRST